MHLSCSIVTVQACPDLLAGEPQTAFVPGIDGCCLGAKVAVTEQCTVEVLSICVLPWPRPPALWSWSMVPFLFLGALLRPPLPWGSVHNCSHPHPNPSWHSVTTICYPAHGRRMAFILGHLENTWILCYLACTGPVESIFLSWRSRVRHILLRVANIFWACCICQARYWGPLVVMAVRQN
jgi:hypothetical protein